MNITARRTTVASAVQPCDGCRAPGPVRFYFHGHPYGCCIDLCDDCIEQLQRAVAAQMLVAHRRPAYLGRTMEHVRR